MKYLLDTNLIIIYSRENLLSERIEKEFSLFNGKHSLAISAVVLGELDALSKKLQHGKKRKQTISKYTDELFTIDINTKKIIDKYGDIDAYSQGKLKSNPLGTSARNMGKNDLWIAATASVYDLTLITTDKDFEHLNGVFLDLVYVDLEGFK
jgi:predicted nucleic acid-binding protein